MESSTIEVIKHSLTNSYQGKVAFPQVVKELLDSGIERYYVDLVANKNIYYNQHEAFSLETPVHTGFTRRPFSQEGVVQAIRASQNGQIDYNEFLHQIIEAGTVGYTAFLTGKQVHYFGALGDVHVEKFPQ